VSTPTFNPTAEEFDDVRLYTELDPYYYTIDNRPLQDIVENVGSLGSSSDAARRATLIEALGSSAVLSGLFGSAKKITGLRATATTASTLTVDPGAMLSPGNISDGDTRQILRVAASPLPVVLSCPAPVTLGREFTYIVQAKFTDFTGAQTYPNYDGANAFLPATLLNGFLQVNIIVGAEANIGASVAPTVTPGWDPLYTVVSAAGAPFPVLTLNASAPARMNTVSAEEQWIAPTLTNGWTNVGGAFQVAQYRRIGNRVFLRGSIAPGTSSAFTLPVGFRPAATNLFPVLNGSSGILQVTITSAGTVTPSSASTTNLGLIEFFVD
jgi:hypothetical protein